MRKTIFIAAAVLSASAAICFFMLNDSHDGQAEGMKADIIRCFKENYNITPEKEAVETLYAVFSAADEITGHKLAVTEMIRMFSFIGAAVTGRNPALNEDMSRNVFMLRDNPVSPVSPVKTAYFLLNNESILHAQTLSGKEKLDCAFLFSYLAEHAKDGSKNVYPTEKFRELMRTEQENNPAKFAFFRT